MYLAVMLFPTMIRGALSQSDSHRAAWVFHGTPASRPALVVAARNFVAAYFLVPYLLLLGVFYVSMVGKPVSILIHMSVLGLLSHLVLVFDLLLNPDDPVRQSDPPRPSHSLHDRLHPDRHLHRDDADVRPAADLRHRRRDDGHARRPCRAQHRRRGCLAPAPREPRRTHLTRHRHQGSGSVGTEDQRPATKDQRPATNDRDQTRTNDQRPTTNDHARPTTNDQRPTTNDQRPQWPPTIRGPASIWPTGW